MNETGHMVVARIAWDTMTPAARREVLDLVKDPNNPTSQIPTTAQDSDQFTAATYMDDIRPALEKLHFDNQYIDADGKPMDKPAETPNAVTFFKQNVDVLANPHQAKDDKAEALRYLMHLTGDLHQPLHVVDRVTPDHPQGDRGGNLFPINWSLDFKENNLHAFWDSAAGEFAPIGRPLSAEGSSKLNGLADQIERQFPQTTFAAEKVADLNPSDWAADGMQIAARDCYQGIQPHARPSDAYKQRTTQDMNQEAALAGYRLGTLLNGIFK